MRKGKVNLISFFEVRLQEIEEKLNAIQAEFREIKEKACKIEPNNWYLTQSELTTLGYKHIAKEIAKFIPPSTNKKILDWGGGMGILTFFIEKLGYTSFYYDFKYGGPVYDLFFKTLKSPKVFAEDPIKLPFEDSTFDGVVSCGVLEHVQDTFSSINEVIRILKPGGYFFVFHYPNKLSYIEFLAKLAGQKTHEHKLSMPEFLTLFKRPQCEVVCYSYKYLLPRNLNQFHSLRSFVNKHVNFLFHLDRVLSKLPFLKHFSTTLNAVIRKVNSN